MIVECKYIYQKLLDELLFHINKREAEAIIRILLEYYLKISISDIIINKKIKISSSIQADLENAIIRLKKNEPIQYIIEKAFFYDYEFIVNKDVLIPRSETEELVNIIISENTTKNLNVLDIGTGSGCIAITLKKKLNQAKVDAIDISEKALKIAKKNSKLLNSEIKFYKIDILNEDLPNKTWDIIVSNPPYVRISEAKKMKKNVLDYEPQKAIFVEDNDPLIFYKKIAEIAQNYLSKQGKVYVEINERFGNEISDIFKSKFAKNVRIIKDINNKDRFIIYSSPLKMN